MKNNEMVKKINEYEFTNKEREAVDRGKYEITKEGHLVINTEGIGSIYYDFFTI